MCRLIVLALMDEAETTILWNHRALRHALHTVPLDWHWFERDYESGILVGSHPTAQTPE